MDAKSHVCGRCSSPGGARRIRTRRCGPAWDFELAIGGNCTINVVHRIDPAGIEHANVTAVLPAMKNIAPLAPLNYTRAKDRPPRPDAPPVFTPVNLATPTQAPLVPVPPVRVLSEADNQ